MRHMSAPIEESGPERWLADWEQATASQIAKARALADGVAGVEVSAVSPDGAIEVRVNAAGVLTGLHLGEQIRKYPPGELATAIMAVLHRAQSGLAGRVADVAARTLGPDDAAGRAVVAGFEQRFPRPVEASGDEATSEHDWQRRRAR
jgi:hypothetical protein